ncbi:hypothetical protein E3N88_00828 [Mikania micrantha]|uniref:Uncharacterized protein n=1 Tax=Mikania micrantha TaxID=192012 RepID=A0A5N6PZJ5_9ASTR|nr:hypothetical protein E3N88_00828 [Mikania micrantha]
MQSSPDAILEWLQKEMGYRPLGPYIASNKASMPSSDAIAGAGVDGGGAETVAGRRNRGGRKKDKVAVVPSDRYRYLNLVMVGWIVDLVVETLSKEEEEG